MNIIIKRKGNIKDFSYAILLLNIFYLIMELIKPANGSIFKLFVSLLMLFSIYLIVRIFFKNVYYKEQVFDNLFKYIIVSTIIYTAYIGYNGFKSKEIFTIFGNQYTLPSLLLPFVLIFSQVRYFFYSIFHIGKIYVIIGLLLASIGIFKSEFYVASQNFLIFSLFLLPFWEFYSKKNRIIIILGLTIYICVGFLIDTRAVSLRGLLQLFFFAYLLISRNKIEGRFFIIFMISISFITAFSYQNEILRFIGGKTITIGGKSISNDDTRTFLYEEVFLDLTQKNDLLIGRGSIGKYKSLYFLNWAESNEGGDSYERLNVEVGFLGILIKGGLILLLLNYSLFLFAIYKGFNFENNFMIRMISLTILNHVLISFVENSLAYTPYYILIWLFVGVCLQKKKYISQTLLIFERFHTDKTMKI